MLESEFCGLDVVLSLTVTVEAASFDKVGVTLVLVDEAVEVSFVFETTFYYLFWSPVGSISVAGRLSATFVVGVLN